MDIYIYTLDIPKCPLEETFGKPSSLLVYNQYHSHIGLVARLLLYLGKKSIEPQRRDVCLQVKLPPSDVLPIWHFAGALPEMASYERA